MAPQSLATYFLAVRSGGDPAADGASRTFSFSQFVLEPLAKLLSPLHGE